MKRLNIAAGDIKKSLRQFIKGYLGFLPSVFPKGFSFKLKSLKKNNLGGWDIAFSIKGEGNIPSLIDKVEFDLQDEAGALFSDIGRDENIMFENMSTSAKGNIYNIRIFAESVI